jgi:predicted RNA-binding Zn-ribbon protein involved in translation (DUF1610 family)
MSESNSGYNMGYNGTGKGFVSRLDGKVELGDVLKEINPEEYPKWSEAGWMACANDGRVHYPVPTEGGVYMERMLCGREWDGRIGIPNIHPGTNDEMAQDICEECIQTTARLTRGESRVSYECDCGETSIMTSAELDQLPKCPKCGGRPSLEYSVNEIVFDSWNDKE